MGRYLLPLKLKHARKIKYLNGACIVKIFLLGNCVMPEPVCVLQNSADYIESSNTCLYVIKNSKFPFKQGLQSVHYTLINSYESK